MRHMHKHVHDMVLPGKKDCLQCIDNEAALHNREWTDVKYYVKNKITTAKRQASRLLINDWQSAVNI